MKTYRLESGCNKNLNAKMSKIYEMEYSLCINATFYIQFLSVKFSLDTKIPDSSLDVFILVSTSGFCSFVKFEEL